MSNAQIMIVEDDQTTAMRLHRSIENMGFGVISTSSSAEQAIRNLVSMSPDLIIMDIALQGEMDGIDAVEKINSEFYIPVIYLTGHNNDRVFDRAKKTNPVGFVVKPFKENELQRVIALGLYRYRTEHRLIRERGEIVRSSLKTDYGSERIVLKRVELLLREERSKQKSLWEVIKLLVSVAERKNPYAVLHQEETCILSCYIAEEMGLSRKQIDLICMAAMLHDVGMVNMTEELLRKDGMLSDKEMELMRTHSQLGYDLLCKLDLPDRVPEIVLQHHEKIDGSGYPAGLSGNKIMLEARIISVADALEAMTSARSYRRAYSLNEALDQLSKEGGTLYDSEVIDACIRVFDET